MSRTDALAFTQPTVPYQNTVDDALWLHDAGETRERILERLNISIDGLKKAFRVTGTPEPVWRVPANTDRGTR